MMVDSILDPKKALQTNVKVKDAIICMFTNMYTNFKLA